MEDADGSDGKATVEVDVEEVRAVLKLYMEEVAAREGEEGCV